MTAKRPPPELKGEEEAPRLQLWMSGKRAEGVVIRRGEEDVGLSLSQSTQYSVLASRDGWLKLRDELSGEIFYLNALSRKTAWSARKTPFCNDTNDADAPSLRDTRMQYFKSLLRKNRLPKETPPTSDTEDPNVTPGEVLPSQSGFGSALPTSAPISSPGSPRAPQDASGVIGATSEAASFRQHLSLFCPYTGNAYTTAMFRQGLVRRKEAVAGLLAEHGIDLRDVPLHEPDVSCEQRDVYNRSSRACFHAMMEAALAAVREIEGEFAVHRLDAALQDLFEGLTDAPPDHHTPFTPSHHGDDTNSVSGSTIFPQPGDYVFLCNPSLSGMPERAYAPPGEVTAVYPLTGYCMVAWEEGLSVSHKFPEEIILA